MGCWHDWVPQWQAVGEEAKKELLPLIEQMTLKAIEHGVDDEILVERGKVRDHLRPEGAR